MLNSSVPPSRHTSHRGVRPPSSCSDAKNKKPWW